MDDQALARSDTAVRFSWEDAFFLDDQLSEDERAVRDTARAHAQEKLLPRINEAYLEEISERPQNVRSDIAPTVPRGRRRPRALAGRGIRKEAEDTVDQHLWRNGDLHLRHV
jgi:hypothetical protein